MRKNSSPRVVLQVTEQDNKKTERDMSLLILHPVVVPLPCGRSDAENIGCILGKKDGPVIRALACPFSAINF